MAISAVWHEDTSRRSSRMHEGVTSRGGFLRGGCSVDPLSWHLPRTIYLVNVEYLSVFGDRRNIEIACSDHVSIISLSMFHVLLMRIILIDSSRRIPMAIPVIITKLARETQVRDIARNGILLLLR
jgi:hypothetical protein